MAAGLRAANLGKLPMNATRIIELMNRSPFQPLEVHLNDGTSILVEHPYQIATKRNSPTCTIYDAEDRMHVVSYRNISEVITASLTE
jgi:hypothetical protein